MPKMDVDDELVRKLAALLDETGLTELEYTAGDEKIRVVRGGVAVATAAPVPPQAPSGLPMEPAAASLQSVQVSGAVTAPMVGTVYLSPEPGAPPFVKVGDTVSEGQTLLLIEAMKTFNPVRAPRSGRVTRFLITDGSPVEYGEALVLIE